MTGNSHNFKQVVRQLKDNNQIVFMPEQEFLFIFPQSIVGNRTWGKIDFLKKRINFDIVRIKDRSDVDKILANKTIKNGSKIQID